MRTLRLWSVMTATGTAISHSLFVREASCYCLLWFIDWKKIKIKKNLLPVSKKRPLFSHFSLWRRALEHGRWRLLVCLPSCWLQPVWAWEGAGGAMTRPGPPVLALLPHVGTPWAERGGMAS